MEIVLNRKLQEKRIFPAIDLLKSGTRKDELLLSPKEKEVVDIIRKGFNDTKVEENIENLLTMFRNTYSNDQLIELLYSQFQKGKQHEQV